MSKAYVRTSFCGKNQQTGGGLTQVVETYTAGENISALKVLWFDDSDSKVKVADNTQNTEVLNVVGVALNGALADDPVQVLYFGELTHLSFLFDAGTLLYLNSTGGIVDTTTGNILQIARAVEVGKIFVQIQEPIIR